jgi:cation diffusion facilitator CzcD-associated flavoprotein CzcO
MTTETSTPHTEIAIVGAGLSGLGMAIALRRDGHEDFVVLERAGALGGTWRDNDYPGCACDIPSVLYAYSDEPNPAWTHAYAPQPEIRDYIQGVAERHGAERFMRYDHELLGADWDAERGVWELDTAQGRRTASVLVSAAGALADPSVPDLTGLQHFAGAVFHSARWNHDQDLTGRRVAVVGTGASAIQFVPEIQPHVDHLTLFQRTAPWVLPRSNPRIPRVWRQRFARHPRLQALARGAVFSVMESLHVGFRHPAVMRLAERQARAHIAREVADPALRARLTPAYRLGCKRVLGADNWYPALTQPNVEVVSGGIREVVADGVIDTAGVHHPVDTIIFGTGFHVTDMPIARRIRGRGGLSLAEIWQGSPEAHLGMTVAGFPNLCFLLGPNTGLGHNSVLLMIEAQIAYLRELLALRAARGGATVEPTPQAQARSVAEVDRGTEGSVWTAGGCQSWYVDPTGRNSTLWPGSVRAYQRRLARLEPSDYLCDSPVGAQGRPRSIEALQPTIA